MKQIFAHPHQMESTDFGWPRNFLQWNNENQQINTYEPSQPTIEKQTLHISNQYIDFNQTYIKLPDIEINNQTELLKFNLDENNHPLLKTDLTSITINQDTFANARQTQVYTGGTYRQVFQSSYLNNSGSLVGVSVAKSCNVNETAGWSFNFPISRVHEYNGTTSSSSSTVYNRVAFFPSGYSCSVKTSSTNNNNPFDPPGLEYLDASTMPTDKWLFGIGSNGLNWYQTDKGIGYKAFYLISPAAPTLSMYTTLPSEFLIQLTSNRTDYRKPILIVSGAWLMTTEQLTVWNYKEVVRSSEYDYSDTDNYYNTGMSSKTWANILT